jgi:hypothetical protein
LVTITGTGGVDKTHLALEVGHRVAPRFSDGVVFVSLAAIRDPDLVLPTIANELGIRDFVLTERGVCRLHPQLARIVTGLGGGRRRSAERGRQGRARACRSIGVFRARASSLRG